ncbi:glycogen synthase GlgA [Fusibacter sp. JL216-2]|uniref:glycogen synthase GlgA n=1 Tax=Fusibacter sp. JL216-2 TaxID=3071453 RepID=UPI003D33F2FB
MNVLFVASEAVPFSKTGGLADVAFALPKALRKENVDARVMISKTFDLPDYIRDKERHLSHFYVDVGWRRQYVGLSEIEYEGLPYYFIDNEYYFKRDGLYGHFDDGEKFSYFCRSVLESIRHMDFKPDIIHFNDWHTGMIPVLLNEHYRDDEDYRDIKTVYTIHNLKYQGVFGPEILNDLLNIGPDHYYSGGMEFHGGVSFMKSGINFADAITTVSETYAQEIQYPFFGERLDGLLRHRENDLYGITNGLDHDIYDPRKDPHIVKKYDSRSLKKKRENKTHLQDRMGLPVNEDIPMMAMVTRLANMKGLDLIEHVMDDMMKLDIQFVVLGTGEAHYENMMRYYQHKYPDKVRAEIQFNAALAHQIYAGADMFLMPSLFEPCGLGQQIALRYGTLPIVRETGGLKDTVTPYNAYTDEGNGFSFANYNAHEMLGAIEQATALFRDRRKWNRVVQRAMKSDTSWKNSARQYIDIYQTVMNR